jgi:hypothetical protein
MLYFSVKVRMLVFKFNKEVFVVLKYIYRKLPIFFRTVINLADIVFNIES